MIKFWVLLSESAILSSKLGTLQHPNRDRMDPIRTFETTASYQLPVRNREALANQRRGWSSRQRTTTSMKLTYQISRECSPGRARAERGVQDRRGQALTWHYTNSSSRWTRRALSNMGSTVNGELLPTSLRNKNSQLKLPASAPT